VELNPQPLPPSPNWTRAMPTGPDARVKFTEDYARHVARDGWESDATIMWHLRLNDD
jgi:hypothetical protein